MISKLVFLMLIQEYKIFQMMFLEKYKNKRRLGRGAYGDVCLVENEKGELFALKLISTKMIEAEPHLQQYLDGQIQCMKTLDSPHIIKLHSVEQDNDYYYLLLEYCDGGDLANYQAKLKQKVFSLKKATQVMAEVIMGLQALHQQQYLHRDIKPENVLVKNENGREIFKLADFGFSKKQAEVEGTILGTEQYIAPQIFKAEQYGYEIDMWAFGVLFYFMLNLDYPFKMNPYWPPHRKEAELRRQAQNFSYAATVKKTKRRIMSNCNQDMENLFKQIFELDPKKRINFAQIRKHPIFAKHFPQIPKSSVIMYSQKYKRKETSTSKISKFSSREEPSPYTPGPNRLLALEKSAIDRKKAEKDFLRDNVQIFMKCEENILKMHEKYMLTYNLQKYYIILLKKFRSGLISKKYQEDHYPGLQWDDYSKSSAFQKQIKQIDKDLAMAESKFQSLYETCASLMKDIEQINSGFKKAFKKEIDETQFEGDFKDSYRKSTVYVFGSLRQMHKKGKNKGNRLNYLLCILLISNSFNTFFVDKQSLQNILSDYFIECKKTVDTVDYLELRQWLEKADDEVLHEIAKRIVIVYFGGL